MSRRRSVPLVLAVAAAAAALAVTLGAWSGSGRVVTVTHGAMTTTFIDNGVSGPSQGDLRVFDTVTAIKGSSTTGHMEAVMTTTAVGVPDADTELRVAQLVFTFGDIKNQIVVDGLGTYPTSGSTLATETVTVRPIIGGSGTYKGANGWCESFHLADGSWRHVFHLER